ncbi:hypothetical protein ACJIZ3_005913 [Penstemon smallii]|uniref:Knottins-like domain-containing protein n=1 Tax=Penstemon smallii TaxID=265156 RepID=A0ABD3S6C6_9LAMI
MMTKPGEAAMCESPSRFFKGLCFSSKNCGTICEKEDFIFGHCKKFKCICDPPPGEEPPEQGPPSEGPPEEDPPSEGPSEEDPPNGDDRGDQGLNGGNDGDQGGSIGGEQG